VLATIPSKCGMVASFFTQARSMAPPINPHDKFFRATMRFIEVAQDFFHYYLPKDIRQALDMNSIRLEPTSYVTEELQESFSDLVYSCNLAGEQAYVSILVEHQSTAKKFMPVRVHHYLFNLLHEQLKTNGQTLLPAVYGLVFYHGEETPYPYSMRLADCFNDPLGVMRRIFNDAIPLIDANQLSEEELKRQSWVGPMVRILKHIRDPELDGYLVDLMEDMAALGLDQPTVSELIITLINYALIAGKIKNIPRFLQESRRRLPASIGEKIMTFAEYFEAKGKLEGEAKGKLEGKLEAEAETTEKIAINSLREGAEPSFVAKITGLSLAAVLELKEQLVRQ
jgi:predicted transposase/invertase (TIGR01784 family)